MRLYSEKMEFPTFSTFSTPFCAVAFGRHNPVMSPTAPALCKKICIPSQGSDCEIICEDCGKPKLFHRFHRFFHKHFSQPLFRNYAIAVYITIHSLPIMDTNFLNLCHFHGRLPFCAFFRT